MTRKRSSTFPPYAHTERVKVMKLDEIQEIHAAQLAVVIPRVNTLSCVNITSVHYKDMLEIFNF
jgi:hypothetical protein